LVGWLVGLLVGWLVCLLVGFYLKFSLFFKSQGTKVVTTGIPNWCTIGVPLLVVFDLDDVRIKR